MKKFILLLGGGALAGQTFIQMSDPRFVRLPLAVALGDDVGGCQVCWPGGWDINRVLYVAMVVRLPAYRDCTWFRG